MVSLLLSSGWIFRSAGRQAAIDEDEAGMIFEFAVGSPLHADHLRREDGEPGIAECDDSFGTGDRVVRRVCGG